MYTYTYIHIYEFDSLQQFASLAEIGLISICDNSKITIAVPRSRYSVQNLFVIKNERGKKEGKEGREEFSSFISRWKNVILRNFRVRFVIILVGNNIYNNNNNNNSRVYNIINNYRR